MFFWIECLCVFLFKVCLLLIQCFVIIGSMVGLKKTSLDHREEKEKFFLFLKDKGYNTTAQRVCIVDCFFSLHGHMTQEDLYFRVKEFDKKVGLSTVYRTLKILCESGLAQEVRMKDGQVFYEHSFNHKHHDHLVCKTCDSYEEIVDEKLEACKRTVYQDYGYLDRGHELTLYGICSGCQESSLD